MIRVWQSYSCNNSSSFRLVAKFADAATALDAAAELEQLFPVHAAEVDAREGYRDEGTAATKALGDKYGFDWSELMQWGSGGMTGDSPDVFVEDTVLIVQHTYCGGGLAGLDTYLEARGATTSADDTSSVPVTLLFPATARIEYLDDELAKMFSQRTAEETYVEPLQAPWDMEEEAYGHFSYFRDAGTVGLHFPLDPRDLENVKNWLRIRGITKYVLRIDTVEDRFELEAIRNARCSACGGALEYLHPALHDIEAPQLVCRPCGGFYEVSTFTK